MNVISLLSVSTRTSFVAMCLNKTRGHSFRLASWNSNTCPVHSVIFRRLCTCWRAFLSTSDERARSMSILSGLSDMAKQPFFCHCFQDCQLRPELWLVSGRELLKGYRNAFALFHPGNLHVGIDHSRTSTTGPQGFARFQPS